MGLGLFLFLAICPLCGAEEGLSLSASAGTIWVDRDGAALHGQAAASFGRGPWTLGAGLDWFSSSLPQADFTALLVSFSGSLALGQDKLTLTGGIFRHGELRADLFNTPVYNEGGGLYYLAAVFPLLRISRLSLSTLCAAGQGLWNSGDFYWFFGKPYLPAVRINGLSAVWDGRYTLACTYLSLEADLLNNEGDYLFESRLKGLSLSLAAEFNWQNGGAQVLLGWFFAGGSLEGALTADNQHYSLFPYTFYNAEGSAEAHLGYGALQARQRLGPFQTEALLGAAWCFSGTAEGTIHYKNKRLFGGGESQERLAPLSLAEAGAIFLRLRAEFQPPLPRFTPRTAFTLGLEKSLILPKGPAAPSGEAASPSPGSPALDAGLLRSILLSGLSLYLKAKL